MKNTYGGQQGDTWLRNRVGRITGSRLAEVCSYLVIKSRAGESSEKRNKYRMELIAERLTGRAKDHYVSPAMEHGTSMEDDARLYYEGAVRDQRGHRMMCLPVSFVLHPKYSFTGSSPDSLVGTEGVLEIKCPESTTHLGYILGGKIPSEYLPQIAWELACTERKWADFVSYDPRIQDDQLRFLYRRVSREELEWQVGERKLTGEAVIDYFTSEVLKLNAEIEYFFAEHGAQPIAPYPVQILEDEGSAEEISEDQARESAADYIDQFQVAP